MDENLRRQIKKVINDPMDLNSLTHLTKMLERLGFNEKYSIWLVIWSVPLISTENTYDAFSSREAAEEFIALMLYHDANHYIRSVNSIFNAAPAIVQETLTRDMDKRRLLIRFFNDKRYEEMLDTYNTIMAEDGFQPIKIKELVIKS